MFTCVVAKVVSGTPMAMNMHPMTLLDHGINECPSAHWPSRSVWFLCENDGCDGTERPADDQEADTLPGCKRALSKNHRVGRERGPWCNWVIVIVCLLRERDLVSV